MSVNEKMFVLWLLVQVSSQKNQCTITSFAFTTFQAICYLFQVEANKEISLEVYDAILRVGSSKVALVIEIRCLLQN